MRLVVCGLAVVLLAGCGAQSRDLSADAASLLQKDVAAMRSAARAGDGTALQAAYAQLRQDVLAGRSAGSVSPTRAAQVLTAAAAVAADVPAPAPKPTPTVSPAAVKPVVKAPAPAPRKHHREKHEKHDD